MLSIIRSRCFFCFLILCDSFVLLFIPEKFIYYLTCFYLSGLVLNLLKYSLISRLSALFSNFNQLQMFFRNWTLSDICFKPPSPHLPQGPLTSLMSRLLDRLIPCIWITPIDCFWEGSKPLGPSPPLNFGCVYLGNNGK